MTKKSDLMNDVITAIHEYATDNTIPPDEALKEIAKLTLQVISPVDKGENRMKAKVLEVKDFVLNNGLMFNSAEEITDALNAAGLVTTRDKPWTKPVTTRVMVDVRGLIADEMRASRGAAAVAKTADAPVETADAPVETADAPVEIAVVTTATVAPVEEVIKTVSPGAISVETVSLDSDLDELELLENLSAA